jgi:hypothetical protein
MAKMCRLCKSDQNELFKDSSRKDGLENLCKECSIKKNKKYNQEHPEWKTYQGRVGRTKRIKIARLFISEYLKDHPCVDCGEKDIVVLEFDHISNKIENISQMMCDDWPLIDIKKEITKCEVSCANYHRRKTAKQFNWYKQ